MQKKGGAIICSASDVVNFRECEHLTSLDLVNLDTPLPKAEDDEEALLYQTKGLTHEHSYVEHLKQKVSRFEDISNVSRDDETSFKATLDAMRAGADIIYQGTLLDGSFVGHPDFLRKVPGKTGLGNFGYEVVDTKLARSAKAKFIIQLCFYSDLLALSQGSDPVMLHVVLGDRTEQSFRYADYSRYYRMLKKRFVERVSDRKNSTYPEECENCGICRWRNICAEQWTKDDHLNQVANITRLQIKKLRDCRIDTLEALAECKKGFSVRDMAQETFEKLRHQASLQLHKRRTEENKCDVLKPDPDGKRGFARLPEPDEGDIFFDMEGDPLSDEGLEYLFGVYYLTGGRLQFRPFWAHNRNEEKRAFMAFMDFVTAHIRKNPRAHIYHYASYEETALKKLMSLHAVCEAEVDNLLRQNRLIDLYKVVREGIRISEPRYSIKNVEHFYLPERKGEVKDAGASAVYYEKYKETGDKKYLAEIESYNRDDVISTHGLREWLISKKPEGIPWATDTISSTGKAQNIDELNFFEQKLEEYRQNLINDLPADRDDWGPEHHIRELTYQLLDFHRRTDKPVWWALFERSEMTPDELMDDPEAIGKMQQDRKNKPYIDKQSYVYTYTYPEQEHKLKTGDNCVITNTRLQISKVVIDDEKLKVNFRLGIKRGLLPDSLSISAGGPIDSRKLQDALFCFADSIINDERSYPAIEAILRRELPRIKGRRKKKGIIDESGDILPQIIEAVANLDRSYIFIQGPPGSGKTYTGSHVIVDLLRRGFRVGVSSNSHKAINNMLSHVERIASEQRFIFRGAKKSTSDNEDTEFRGRFICDCFKNEDLIGGYQLIAGTAWLFADEAADHTLDFLFVDEAGQVSLANLIAMGTSARNIVLLGDQMQLSQPIQGVHPGESGESTLDYLLEGAATIPPERGIFLPRTWRMHPDLCRFISDAVYNSRLQSEESTKKQRLVLGPDAHTSLRSTGIVYVPVQHDACSQKSREEAQVVKELYDNLLAQHYIDKKGKKKQVTGENILVVAPYNMQVNELKRILPPCARVGTVDKFQGQEAEVVIISMATSSGEYLPRNIEFLYSKNRLNVALSRARCLSILIANPALMTIRCTTIEQMALVNTLCWAKEYSEDATC
ncbi:MAG: nuclease [Deltaproteobacteria bacterium]|nr:nuclease [Deltaproteobacteria bacterium]